MEIDKGNFVLLDAQVSAWTDKICLLGRVVYANSGRITLEAFPVFCPINSSSWVILDGELAWCWNAL